VSTTTTNSHRQNELCAAPLPLNAHPPSRSKRVRWWASGRAGGGTVAGGTGRLRQLARSGAGQPAGQPAGDQPTFRLAGAARQPPGRIGGYMARRSGPGRPEPAGERPSDWLGRVGRSWRLAGPAETEIRRFVPADTPGPAGGVRDWNRTYSRGLSLFLSLFLNLSPSLDWNRTYIRAMITLPSPSGGPPPALTQPSESRPGPSGFRHGSSTSRRP
jgi:hypothetical protein